MPVKKSSAKKTTKTTVKKVATTASLRAIAKQSRKKIATSPKAPRNDNKLSVPVYSLTGRAAGTLSLPKAVFAVPVNEKLLAQALRVYMTNQKVLPGSTKTRGQVEGSSAKIYRQKGTGRARHGSIRAPIFVGGGIVFGPKPRKVRLTLPTKMKKAALISALSSKMKDQGILGVTGLEKATGKTKEIAKFMSSVVSRQSSDKKQKSVSALIVIGEKMDNIASAARNIKEVTVLPVDQLNAYEVLRHQLLVITKDAVEKLGVHK